MKFSLYLNIPALFENVSLNTNPVWLNCSICTIYDFLVIQSYRWIYHEQKYAALSKDINKTIGISCINGIKIAVMIIILMIMIMIIKMIIMMMMMMIMMMMMMMIVMMMRSRMIVIILIMMIIMKIMMIITIMSVFYSANFESAYDIRHTRHRLTPEKMHTM